MSDPIIEPKKTVSDTVDDFFSNRDAEGVEQPQDTAQPENEQVATPTEDGSDPVKTPSTEDTTKDKGFASHPAWQAREQKLKETEARAKQLEQDSQRYAKLLDDPAIYRKFLESQGFRPEQIEQAMAEKGFQVETKSQSNSPAAQDIAEATCKKLGWDITRLNNEQRAYINDQISLIKAVAEDMFGEKLNERLRPMEGFLQQQQTAQKVAKGYEDAKREAKTEFPDLDWDKDIEPAMAKYLDDLDKRDPKGTIQIDAMTLYEKATRQLLKEKKISEGRQEVRNDLKRNARPLVPRASITGDKNSKGKSVRETADTFLDSLGMKNE